MRTQIKKYVLNKNLTEQILIDNGFKYANDKSDSGIYGPVYFYFKTLYDDIELHVEIGINDDGTLSFNDTKNVLVFDDECGQMYHPFYREDVDTPYVNSVIAGYNEAMDYLASKGILKEKTMEDNIDKDIIFQDYKPLVIDENTIQNILTNPKAHTQCPLRTRSGRIYTNDGYKKRTDELSKKDLP